MSDQNSVSVSETETDTEFRYRYRSRNLFGQNSAFLIAFYVIFFSFAFSDDYIGKSPALREIVYTTIV